MVHGISIDSYLWVMNQNVYIWFFVGGGLTMRRPYISTSVIYKNE